MAIAYKINLAIKDVSPWTSVIQDGRFELVILRLGSQYACLNSFYAYGSRFNLYGFDGSP